MRDALTYIHQLRIEFLWQCYFTQVDNGNTVALLQNHFLKQPHTFEGDKEQTYTKWKTSISFLCLVEQSFLPHRSISGFDGQEKRRLYCPQGHKPPP